MPDRRAFPALLLLLAGLLLPTATAAQAPASITRVRLLEEHTPTRITVQSPEGRLALLGRPEEHNALAEIEAGTPVEIAVGHGELVVTTPDVTIHALTVHLVPEATLNVSVVEGDAPPETRSYPGLLAVSLTEAGDELLLINHVALEDYVACVVGREYGFDDLEGAKAVAVLTRTYTIRSAGKFGDGYDHVDHSGSQVYEGLGRRTDTALQAAEATRGEVLTHGGELIEAVYFSASGGHTANNEDVWDGRPLPYLRGRPDPYTGHSPYAAWQSTVDRDRLLAILSDTYGFTVDGFMLASRSEDGRAATIELLRSGEPHRTIRSNNFRLLVNRHFGKHTLRSTFFTPRRKGNSYVFEGKGFGHGVGLSQYGALAQSRQGRSYRDILDFYFTDVTLTTLDDIGRVQPVESVIRPASQTVLPPPEQREAQDPKKKKDKPRIGW